MRYAGLSTGVRDDVVREHAGKIVVSGEGSAMRILQVLQVLQLPHASKRVRWQGEDMYTRSWVVLRPVSAWPLGAEAAGEPPTRCACSCSGDQCWFSDLRSNRVRENGPGVCATMVMRGGSGDRVRRPGKYTSIPVNCKGVSVPPMIL